MASKLPWNRPGASGEPTSAMTSTLIVVGVIPTSVACSVTLAQGFGAVDDVDAAGAAAEVVLDGLLELLREQPAAITRTATNPDSATDFLTDPPGARKPD